jgi:hypothetical protein
MLLASLPHIYGPADFEANRERILAEHGTDKVMYEVLIICPRRWGKTFSVAMFCAAALLTCPHMNISVFSTGQRASSSLLDLCAKFALSTGKARVLKKNQENFHLKGSSSDDVRVLNSFPSSVSGLKGQGGKIVILEEASRLDKEVFTEVIVPLLGVKDTALIGISTPLDSTNFYSELITARKPNGDPLFNVLEISLMCEECKRAGSTSCPHSKELPPWKTGERQEMVKQLMASNSAMYMREQLGVITTADTKAFGQTDILRAFKEENWALPNAISQREIFVAVDPCGGGVSGLAIVAGGFTASESLVVRALPLPCPNTHARCRDTALLTAHCRLNTPHRTSCRTMLRLHQQIAGLLSLLYQCFGRGRAYP